MAGRRARAPVVQAVTIPQPLDLIGELDELKDKALNAKREWVAKNGQRRSYSQPDYRAALMAVRIKAEICGYIGEKPTWDTRDLVADAVRRALSDGELRKLVVSEIRKLEPGLLTDGAGSSP